MTDAPNYFEFYGLPVAFGLDETRLKQLYYENSRRYHPDHFGTENAAKQAEVLQLSTLNNTAYKTLKDFGKRAHYILHLHGLVTEGDKHTLPPAFLMEMMDVNEALMELEMEPDAAKLQEVQQQTSGWEEQVNQQLQELGAAYDTAAEEEKSALLQQIKEAYHKSKYILRLKDSLHRFAAL